MSAFRVHDLWGIIGGMLVLIAMYLVLNNSKGATSILGSLFSGSGTMVTDLQGR